MPELYQTDDTTSQNNEQEVEINDEELALLDDETTKKVQTLSAQKAHFRDKAKKAEEKLKELEAKLSSTQQTPPQPAPSNQSVQSAEEAARRALLALRAEEEFAQIPEDKRATVKEFYGSLTQGKTLDVSSHTNYLEAAKRAAGISFAVGRSHHSLSSFASGSVPPATPPGPSKEDIEMAKRAGNDPNKVYGKDADYSGLYNAEKFLGKKEDEFN